MVDEAVVQNAFHFRSILIRLPCLTTALRVYVIPAGVVGVDGTVKRVIVGTVEGVLVKARLGHHSVWVIKVGSVAEEELDVTLLEQRGAGEDGDGGERGVKD